MTAPTNFRHRLGAELHDLVEERRRPAPRRLGWLAVPATGFAAAVVAAVALFGTPSGDLTALPAPAVVPTPPAVQVGYQVRTGPDGTVDLALTDPDFAQEFQRALDEAGIPAIVLTPTEGCTETVKNTRGLLEGLSPPDLSENERFRVKVSAIPKGSYLLFIYEGFERDASGALGTGRIRLALSDTRVTCVPETPQPSPTG